ncbi:MAG: hypothetical protein RLZZ516_1040 [Cyanobacteriota bacterium]
MADKEAPPGARLITGDGEAELMSEVDCTCPECVAMCAHSTCLPEVGAFYWTVLAPDIVNSRREEQGSISV